MEKIALFLLLSISLFAKNLDKNDTNIYERNCVPCHKKFPISLEKLFFRYLLKYSSEKSVKQALIDYLKDPNYYTTVITESNLIDKYGLKQKTKLTDKELKEAIDIYWEKYKVIGKLK